MTPREAIVKVLRDAGREMTLDEIAAALADRDLYRRGDGQPPPPSQVSTRMNHPRYRHLFYRNPETDAWSLRAII